MITWIDDTCFYTMLPCVCNQCNGKEEWRVLVCNCDARGASVRCSTCGSVEPQCAPCYGLKDHQFHHSLIITAESIIVGANVIHHNIKVNLNAIKAKQEELYEIELEKELGDDYQYANPERYAALIKAQSQTSSTPPQVS